MRRHVRTAANSTVCVCVVENVLRKTRDNREEDIGKIGMENGGGV